MTLFKQHCTLLAEVGLPGLVHVAKEASGTVGETEKDSEEPTHL